MKNKNLSGGLFVGKPLTILETPLSAQIAEFLDNRRIYNDRLQCGSIKTQAGNWIKLCKTGTPDRFAIIRGQIIFIEVKMRDKRPSAEQIERHEILCASGAIVLVCDNFDEFIGKFNAIRAALESVRKATELYD